MSAARESCRQVFNLTFPDECRVCGEALRETSRVPVCGACWHSLEPMQAEFFCTSCHTPFLNRAPLDESGHCTLCRLGLSGFDAAYAFGSHEGALRTLVHLLKYQKVRTLARPLAKLVASRLPADLKFDAIVPMPMHWMRRIARGFNHSDLLAAELMRELRVPLLRPVRRVKRTPPQAGLTNAKRRDNVRGAFRVTGAGRRKIAGLRLLLIDDVLTTGVTAAACARVLRRAGASHVSVAVVARADRRATLSYSPDFSSVPRVAAAGSSV